MNELDQCLLNSDLEINMENLPLDLLDLKNDLNNDNNGGDNSSSGSNMVLDLLICQNEPVSNAIKFREEESGLDDPMAQFKSVSDETTFLSEIPTATDIEEAIVIKQGGRKQPVSLLGDDFCEEIQHPHLFSYRKFRYKTERKIRISPVHILIKDF